MDKISFHQLKHGDKCFNSSVICPEDLRNCENNMTVLFVEHNSV